MRDVSLQIKAKVLARLDSDSSVTSLVPQTSIYPMQVKSGQTMPFVRYGVPEVRPYEDWCGRGSEVEVTMFVCAADETSVQRISSAVGESLAGMDGVVDCTWIRTQFMQDADEADTWYGLVTVVVTDVE